MIIGKKYEVIEEIGRGGMGNVYKVRHCELNAIFALKMLITGFVGDEDLLRRFHNEARIMAQLRHQNIVRVFDIDHDDYQFYFVMEYVHGKNLAQIVEQQGPLSTTEVIRITQQVGQALVHAHGFKPPIIHRDIKPSNIMIEDGTGNVVLTDFGIAKLVDPNQTSFTQTGSTVGTIRYSSPEQLRGCADIDVRTDIYSTGLVIYEMCTGHAFYNGLTDQAVIGDVLYNHKESRPQFDENVPLYIRKAVAKSIAKDRNLRYASVTSLLAAIEVAQQAVRTKWIATNKRSWTLFIALGLVVISASVLLLRYLTAISSIEEHTLRFSSAQQKEIIPNTVQWPSYEYMGDEALDSDNDPIQVSQSSEVNPWKNYSIDRVMLNDFITEALISKLVILNNPPDILPKSGSLVVNQMEYALTVETDPENAQIRILNIKPKYHSGIRLSPGRYHIEVTKQGFVQHRQWIEMANADRILSISLDPTSSSSQHVKKQNPGSESDIASLQSRPQIVPDHKAVSLLLHRFKLAYENKNLAALQSIAQISRERTEFLEQLFRDYRTIEVSVSEFSISSKQNLASAKVEVERLIDHKGDHIIPAGEVMQEELIVRKSGHQWGKIEW